MKNKTVTLENEKQTEDFAADFAKTLRPGHVVLLNGDLGAGKTALSRYIIRSLSNNPELAVPSPTFTLVQTYDCPKMEIWHFDLYRLSSEDEIYELGWEDALSEKLVLIEWPERLGSHMDDIDADNLIAINIEFDKDDNERRVLEIK